MTISVNSAAGAKGNEVNFVTDADGNVTGLIASDGRGKSIAQLSRGGSVRRNGKPIVRYPTSTSGVLLSSNVTISATTRRGRNCWEVTFPAETANKSVYWPITSRTYSAGVHATFEVENAAEWNGGNWRIGLFTDININVGMRCMQTVGSATGYNGVHCLAPLDTEWTAVGAGSWASTMTYAAFQGVRKSSPTGTTRIWIYEVVESDKQSLPQIILGADDGHLTWYTDGLPVLEKYGFPSYLAYIEDYAVDGNGGLSMTKTQWQDAIARGHYAVVHGPKLGLSSLRDYFSSYVGYDSVEAAQLADIVHNRDGMIAAGLDPDGRGRSFYVYPQGYHQPSGGAGDDTIANALAAAGMTGARLAAAQNGIVVNGIAKGMRGYLPILGHSYAGGSEATNISALITAMQSEIGMGRSVIFMFHQVKASPTLAQEITAANLELIVSAANDLVQAGSARPGKLTDLVDEMSTYE